MNASPHDTTPTEEKSARHPALLPGLLLFLIAVICAWPTRSGSLVYDDLTLVASNPQIQSFANLPDVFARSYWEGFDEETVARVGYWRPLTTVALMLGHAIAGGAPEGFHTISILVHAVVALAAMALARRLADSTLIGFFTGLLFALHPVQVESVAWISAIGDPLAGLGVLLSLDFFVRWRERGSQGFPLAAGAVLFVALLAKEVAFAAIPMALAIDLGRKRNTTDTKTSLLSGIAPVQRAYAPFALAFFLYYVARVAVFGDWTGGFVEVVTEFGVPASRLALLRVELFGGFVGLLFWPAELNLFRPFRPVVPFGDPAVTLAIAWCVVTLGVAIYLIKKQRGPGLTAWLLIPASLLPVLGRVTALGIFPLADRYLYLAVFGFAFSIVLLAHRLIPARVAPVALSLLAAVYGARSFARTDFWQDERTLFAEAVEQSPTSPYVHWGFGRVLLTEYQRTKRPELLELAIETYQSGTDLLDAARTDQTIFKTLNDEREITLGLGWCYLFEAEIDGFNDYSTARAIFQRAVTARPNSANARTGLGIALMFEGEDDRAGLELRKAINLNPLSDEAHCAMGRLTIKLGDYEAAIKSFERALELKPGHMAYMLYLVQPLELKQDDARIRELLEEAHARYPDAPEPMRMLGTLAVRSGNSADGLRWYDQALEIDPHDGFSHLQRGVLLVELEQPVDGLTALLEACDLMPDDFDAHYNAAALLLQSKDPSQAYDFLMRAYLTRPPGTGGVGSIGEVLASNILQIRTPDAQLLWELAEADRQRGETASALDWVDRSLKLREDSGVAHYTRALLLVEDEERREEAVRELERAVQLEPKHFGIQHDLGNALAQTDRKQEAIEHLLEALKLIPSSGMDDVMKGQVHAAISRMMAQLQSEIAAGEEG